MKIIGLSTVAFGFAILMVLFTDVHTEVSFTRWDSISFDLGPIGWVFWAAFIIIAMSNAVNLTDGLDGLAAGSSTLYFSAFTVISFWAFQGHPEIYQLDHALDLAVVAVSMLGACVGFMVECCTGENIYGGYRLASHRNCTWLLRSSN